MVTSSNVKSQDEGKTESEELLCVSQAFKKLPEVDFNSDQVMFFTVLELVMCSWGSPHTHGYECPSSCVQEKRWGQMQV